MNWKKFIPTLLPVVGLLLSAFSDQITTFLAANPTLSLVLITVNTAIANALTPRKPE